MTDQERGDDDLTEVFAYFGRAAYMANVLEMALAQTILQIEFMTKVKEEFIRSKGKNFDKQKYEGDFDTFFEKQLGKTMGQLKNRVEELPGVSDELKARIKAAVDRRNFLIHDYWREAGYTFATEEGRAEMIAELAADIDTFEQLAADLREATKPTRQKLGIKDEVLDERVEQRMADIRSGIELE
jgi:hypothetical protein